MRCQRLEWREGAGDVQCREDALPGLPTCRIHPLRELDAEAWAKEQAARIAMLGGLLREWMESDGGQCDFGKSPLQGLPYCFLHGQRPCRAERTRAVLGLEAGG